VSFQPPIHLSSRHRTLLCACPVPGAGLLGTGQEPPEPTEMGSLCYGLNCDFPPNSCVEVLTSCAHDLHGYALWTWQRAVGMRNKTHTDIQT
jgi:hypothetical protein